MTVEKLSTIQIVVHVLRVSRIQHGLYHYILADTQMTKRQGYQDGANAPVEASNACHWQIFLSVAILD